MIAIITFIVLQGKEGTHCVKIENRAYETA